MAHSLKAIKGKAMSHISQLGASVFSDLSISLMGTRLSNLAGTGAVTYDELLKLLTLLSDGGMPGSNFTASFDAAKTSGLFQKEISSTNAVGKTSGAIPALYKNDDSGKYVRITHVKEFPAMGTPANIVNVPIYGRKNSLQIQGQADSPTMELTLNYVPNRWQGNELKAGTDVSPLETGIKVGDGKIYLMRFSLLNKEPMGYNAISANAVGSTEASIGEALDNTAAGMSGVENSSYYFLGKLETLEITPSLSDATTAKLTIAVQSDFYGAYTVTLGTAT